MPAGACQSGPTAHPNIRTVSTVSEWTVKYGVPVWGRKMLSFFKERSIWQVKNIPVKRKNRCSSCLDVNQDLDNLSTYPKSISKCASAGLGRESYGINPPFSPTSWTNATRPAPDAASAAGAQPRCHS